MVAGPAQCAATSPGSPAAGRQRGRDAGVQAGALGDEQGSADGVLEQGVPQPVPVLLGGLHQVAVEQLPQPGGHVHAGADTRCQLRLGQRPGGDGQGGSYLGRRRLPRIGPGTSSICATPGGTPGGTSSGGATSRAAATSCSVKNGLPSPRRTTSATNAGGRRAVDEGRDQVCDVVRGSGARVTASTPASRAVAASQSRAWSSAGSSSRRLVPAARSPAAGSGRGTSAGPAFPHRPSADPRPPARSGVPRPGRRAGRGRR